MSELDVFQNLWKNLLWTIVYGCTFVFLKSNISFTAFNTSYWGNPADPDYIGPKNGTKYESCQFRAFKDNEDDYPHSMDYYYVLMARFGFVLLFQVSTKCYPFGTPGNIWKQLKHNSFKNLSKWVIFIFFEKRRFKRLNMALMIRKW